MKQQVTYYNDEFSTAVITPKEINGDYKYIYSGPWKKFTHFFWYRIIATPQLYQRRCAFV